MLVNVTVDLFLSLVLSLMFLRMSLETIYSWSQTITALINATLMSHANTKTKDSMQKYQFANKNPKETWPNTSLLTEQTSHCTKQSGNLTQMNMVVSKNVK